MKDSKNSNSKTEFRGKKKFDKEDKSRSKEPKDKKKIHKSRRYDDVSTRTATNSADWYFTNERMLKDAASIQYFTALGHETNIEDSSRFPTVYQGPTNITFNDTDKLAKSVPGIMKIGFVPTIGKAQNNADPVNIAARNIYGFVRKENSGSKNYDAPNMMMYLLACDSVYTYYQWMVRLYGLLRKYSAYNAYYNEAILKAINVDAESFRGNISDFRAYINKYVLKANSLCVPNTFKIYDRHMYLVAGLFKDTEALKSQTYVFNPDYIYTYDQANGKLAAVGIGNNPSILTLDDVIETGDMLLNNVLTSQDMAIIKGDILKAFGTNGIYQLAMVDVDYETPSLHDYEILTQIQAAKFLGPIPYDKRATLDITEDTTESSNTLNALKQSVTAQLSFASSGFGEITPTGNVGSVINMYVDDPTPADTMVASRLSHYSVLYCDGNASGATVYNTAVYYGTEVCTTFSIWYLDDNMVAQPFTSFDLVEFVNGFGSGFGALVAALSPFEWHPIILQTTLQVTVASTPSATISYESNIDFDWDNYCVLAPHDLQRLHECATLGEFRIPEMGIMM